jgi:hypothetical protein
MGTDNKLYAGIHDETAGEASFIVTCSTTCTSGANWADAGTSPLDNASTDWLMLVPYTSGTIMAIRFDRSATTVQSQTWNGSTWSGSWTNISNTNTGMHATYDIAMGATVDKANGDIYLAYIEDNSTPGTDDDIHTAIYNGSWTNTTDVITDSGSGGGANACRGITNCGITHAKIAFDENTDDVYVVYAATDPAATLDTQNIYWKKSTDGMTSWGAEQGPLNSTAGDLSGMRVNIMSNERLYVTWQDLVPDDIFGATIADLIPVPTQIVFTNAERTLQSGVCNGSANVFTIELQDSLGVARNPLASTVVRISSDSTGETIYSDDTCSTPVSNGDFTFSTSQNTKSVYIIDTVLSSPTWTLTAARQSGDTLTSDTQSYTLVDTPSVKIRGGSTIRGGTTFQ